MRPPPALLVLCLCAMAGAVLWCWPAAEPAPAPPSPGATATTTGADGQPAAIDEILPVAVAAPSPAGTTPEEDGEESRTDAVIADDRTGPRVRVVRGDPEQPVADAEVCFITEGDAAERQNLLHVNCSRFEWPERLGRKVRTDADGMASLPATRRPWLVSAASGGEFAFAIVRPAGHTVTITLETDEQVTVHVRSAEGAPGADLPVALLQHRAGQPEAETLWQGTSDRDGNAVCRHFQLSRPALRGPPDQERFAAMLAMALPTPAVGIFQGRPADATPVQLQLVPFSRVEVQLTDQQGAPLLSPANLVLWNDRAKDYVLPFPVPRGLERPREQKPVGPVAVTFPFVAANCPVQVAAIGEGRVRLAVSEPAWTPPDPTQPLRIDLPLGPDLALLAGSIVGPDGKPFGPAELHACVWSREAPLFEQTVNTIGDGRFDLPQRPISGQAELWLELRATLVPDTPVEVPQVAAAPPPQQEIGARVHYQALREGERRELGRIVLGALPAVCSGIVVDDLGAPIAGATVTLQRNEPDGDGAPTRYRQRRDPWRDVPLFATKTEADGTFRVSGERPPGELRVRADTSSHFAATAAVYTLGQQLRIVLVRNGVLRGQVLLPDWLADGGVTLTLRPTDETLRQEQTQSIGLARRRRGHFAMQPLHAGRYDALFTIRNVPEPLCVLNDVFVTPGETRDARMQPLDLRQTLYRYRLHAVDAAGRTLPLDGPILARLRKPDGATVDAGFRWQHGNAELITPSPLAELVAFGKGCEPQSLTLGPGDHDVYMRELDPARLYLPGARALCGPEHRVRVSVILTEETGFPQWLSGVDQRTGQTFSFSRWDLGKSNGAWLGLGDDVEVPITRSGKYEVVLRIYATDSERSQQANVPLGTHDLRVDSGSMAAVTVPIDAGKVQEALAKLQRQNEQRGARQLRGR